jgi:hypothetical protein
MNWQGFWEDKPPSPLLIPSSGVFMLSKQICRHEKIQIWLREWLCTWMVLNEQYTLCVISTKMYNVYLWIHIKQRCAGQCLTMAEAIGSGQSPGCSFLVPGVNIPTMEELHLPMWHCGTQNWVKKMFTTGPGKPAGTGPAQQHKSENWSEIKITLFLSYLQSVTSPSFLLSSALRSTMLLYQVIIFR